MEFYIASFENLRPCYLLFCFLGALQGATPLFRHQECRRIHCLLGGTGCPHVRAVSSDFRPRLVRGGLETRRLWSLRSLFGSPTITFMKNFYRSFVLHDTSNTVQHLYQNFADARHYDDVEDPRLEWLEVTFSLYLDGLKKRCNHPREFLTKATYEAVLVTTYFTVACIRHLLTDESFFFVLTLRFNSDPIESLFGRLRMSSGANDTLNVRAALSGLVKTLKTGIDAASAASNVAHAESSTSVPLPAGASSSQPSCTLSVPLPSTANTDAQTPPF
ncbi:hypothetical protein HPB51_018082 [Rhipicephalus microplus]|uniref:Uncharacterized protein n=1 Tax=Rhipicephalus microplus TaxID=6941 RepID=A0A9J6E2I1_RHIMP|nr:hypothetical protein HPB51_018082 [Rhipicephalus microplus]